MSYLPIIVNAGQLQQLPSGQALDVGGWTLPTSGGTEDFVLTADVSGNAIWAAAASSFGDPTADNQLLVATGVGAASWADYLDELTIRNSGNDIAQLGSELVTNGEFATNLDDWTVGSNWIWNATGKAEHTAGSTAAISQDISVTNGTTYQVTYNWTDSASGQLWLTFGSMIGNSPGYASDASNLTAWSFKATSTGNQTLTFTPESATTCKLDNVSVKALVTNSDRTLLIEDSANASALEVRADGTLENLYAGVDSGYSNIYGHDNTAWGFDAHKENVNGYSNTMFGHSAMASSLNGYECDAFGDAALGSMVFGWLNNAWGFNALGNYIGGIGNTAIGANALDELTYGNRCVAIGSSAGRAASGTNETSNNSVYLGYYSKASADGADYEVVIGSSAIGRGTGTIVLGGTNHTAVHLPNDDMKLIFGVDDDFSIEWDETNAVFTVASGKFSFVGGNIETSSAIIGSNIPSPTVDDQVLISTASGIAAWSTAGNDQYLASNGSGVVAWTNKPFEVVSPSVTDKVLTSTGAGTATWQDSTGHVMPTAANQIYAGTGVGTAAWTTNLANLTSLEVDNITINGAAITSDTGAISFNDENLSTTGTVTGTNIPSPTVDDQVLISTAADVASWSTAGNNQVLASDGSGNVAWANKPFGYTMAAPASAGQLYRATGSGAASWTTDITGLTSLGVDNITIDGAIISSSSGAISFSNENLTTTGYVSGAALVASESVIGTQANAGGNRIYSNVYSWKGPDGDSTGILKITLPVSWLDTMLTIRIRGYGYRKQNGIWEVNIGGYTYATGGAWSRYSATKQGAYCPFDSIRLAHDGSKCCILLGTTSTYWSYPQVHVVEVTAGLSGQTQYNTGWACSIESSESGLSGIVECRVDTAPRQVFEDETIYVTTSGSDSTGNGTSAWPYATPERAITELGRMTIGNNAITVDIGPGIYTRTTPLEFKHPFGGQVTFLGDYQKITGEVTTSISATNYDLATVSGNLDYYNVTITFTGGTTLSAGDYILISNASGGTNPDALNGCHKVESYSANIATIRIVHRAGAAHASGTVNIDCVLVRTILKFTMSNGFKADGPYHLGMWEGVVIQGDENHASCDYGLWMLNSPTVLLREDGAGYGTVGIRGWQRGIYAQNNAMVFADYNFVSCCHQYGILATNGGIANIRYGYVSGCNNAGLCASTGSTVSAAYCHVTGVGASGVYSIDGSWIDFTSGVIKAATNNVLYAGNGGGITATAEDVSSTQVYYDSTATCSPARDTQGNGYGNMRGGPY